MMFDYYKIHFHYSSLFIYYANLDMSIYYANWDMSIYNIYVENTCAQYVLILKAAVFCVYFVYMTDIIV
jgi:hypothetical protein